MTGSPTDEEKRRIKRRLAELYHELDLACKTIAKVKPAIDKLEDEALKLHTINQQ